jgi:hypothetical protein
MCASAKSKRAGSEGSASRSDAVTSSAVLHEGVFLDVSPSQ